MVPHSPVRFFAPSTWRIYGGVLPTRKSVNIFFPFQMLYFFMNVKLHFWFNLKSQIEYTTNFTSMYALYRKEVSAKLIVHHVFKYLCWNWHVILNYEVPWIEFKETFVSFIYDIIYNIARYIDVKPKRHIPSIFGFCPN